MTVQRRANIVIRTTWVTGIVAILLTSAHPMLGLGLLVLTWLGFLLAGSLYLSCPSCDRLVTARSFGPFVIHGPGCPDQCAHCGHPLGSEPSVLKQ